MAIFLAVLSGLGVILMALQELAGIRRTRERRSAGSEWAARRRQALAVRPEDVGPLGKADDAYGVLMEVGTPSTTLTLAAFADGKASLYSSAGGEVLDGHGHEQVRTAALALVAEADVHRRTMKRVGHCPKPGHGNVRFNVMSGRGMFAAEEDEEALDNGWSPLARLYEAGVKTMQALRELPA